MPERVFRRYVLKVVTSPYTWPVLGGSLLAAIAFGVHLGESAVGLIDPIHFQGPAVHPRDRGAAIDERALSPPSGTAYRDLYGWDEGRAALAAECVGCETVRVHRARAYSAEVPYFGSRREWRDEGEPAGDGLDTDFAEASAPIGPRDAPVLRYASYPITEDEVVPADADDKPADEAATDDSAD